MMKFKNNCLLIFILLISFTFTKAATWIHVSKDYFLYVDFHISEKYFLYEEDSLKNKMLYGPTIPFHDSTDNLIDVEIKVLPDSTSADFLFYTMYGKINSQEEWFKIANFTEDGAALIQDFKNPRLVLARRINHEVKQNEQGDWELWDLMTNQKIIGLTPTGAANFKNNPEERSLTPITKKEWAIYREKILVE